MKKLNQKMVDKYFQDHEQTINQKYQEAKELAEEFNSDFSTFYHGPKDWFTKRVKSKSRTTTTTKQAIQSELNSLDFTDVDDLNKSNFAEGMKKAENYSSFYNKFGKFRNSKGQFQSWFKNLSYNKVEGAFSLNGHLIEVRRKRGRRDSLELEIWVDGVLA